MSNLPTACGGLTVVRTLGHPSEMDFDSILLWRIHPPEWSHSRKESHGPKWWLKPAVISMNPRITLLDQSTITTKASPFKRALHSTTESFHSPRDIQTPPLPASTKPTKLWGLFLFPPPTPYIQPNPELGPRLDFYPTLKLLMGLDSNHWSHMRYGVHNKATYFSHGRNPILPCQLR